MLEQFGFTKVGQWHLSEDHSSVAHLAHLHGITFGLDEGVPSKRYVVYAFRFDDKTRYVGVTDATGGLGARLGGYRYGNPYPRDTDNRVKEAITTHLSGGGAVTIWIAAPIAELRLPNQTLCFPGFRVLEDYIIAALKPDLNIQGLRGRRDGKAPNKSATTADRPRK